MFTGIVENLGTVDHFERTDAGAQLRIATGYSDLALGESVAVNGICLTVTENLSTGSAQFFASHETLRCTNLGELVAGATVNLERALKAGARLSGHWVQGHVDGIAHFDGATPEGDAFHTCFRIPRALGRYCVEKGSITLNGVSLTLNSVKDSEEHTQLAVHLIPHTWSHTNLSRLKPGDPINVEVDILAKYAERLCNRP